MCEYCGCQALRTVDELAREHDLALEHLRELSRALAADALEDVGGRCRELLRVLASHAAIEEEALLPAMARENPEHVATLLAEHELVERELQAATRPGPLPADDVQRLLRAVDVLRAHITKEQDGLIPDALISLDAGHWEHAERVRGRVGSVLRATGVA